MKPLGLLILANLFAACGRTPLELGAPTPTGGVPGVHDPAGAKQTGGSAGGDDAGDAACTAGCETAPGPIQVYLSKDDIAQALIGVWKTCYGGPAIFTGAPSDTIGVEFTPPHARDEYGDPIGNMYFLTRGPSGLPVRGDGVDYQQTYDVPGGAVICRSLDWQAVYDLGFKYSPCPREWWFHNYDRGHSGALASF